MNETKQIGKGIKTNIVEILVKLPEENVILIKLDSFVNKATLQSFKVNAELAKWLYGRELIKNLIFGFNYIIERYSNSVFKIDVKQKNKGDDFSIGTGFLFRYRKTDGTVISTVITNRHVIEDAISFRILTKDDKELPHSGIHIDTVRDIALIELNDDVDLYSFHIYPQARANASKFWEVKS
ncbi:MAG: trypsin-like peptidase domain-containing protein [Flavisolibacter sp.]|nr:trypsin-like peptidase domain-containing protein [Flavisolibacter sp.]